MRIAVSRPKADSSSESLAKTQRLKRAERDVWELPSYEFYAVRPTPEVEAEMPQTFRVPLRNRVLLLYNVSLPVSPIGQSLPFCGAPAIMRDLRLSSIQMGYAFSVFSLAYGVFEIPMVGFGDRLGAAQDDYPDRSLLVCLHPR